MGFSTSKAIFFPPERTEQEWSTLTRQSSFPVQCQLHEIYIDYNKGYYLSFSPLSLKNDKVLVVCHENDSDLLIMKSWCEYMAMHLQMKIVCVEYLGYGPRSYEYFSSYPRRVVPNEYYCYASLEEVIEALLCSGTKKENIHLLGHSLGTGVVVDYALKFSITNCIILISPYKSIARVMYNGPGSSFLYPIDHFVTWHKIDKLSCPVKFFHGQSDTLIHWSHSSDLYQYVKDKMFNPTYFPGRSHNDMLEVITPEMLLEVMS